MRSVLRTWAWVLLTLLLAMPSSQVAAQRLGERLNRHPVDVGELVVLERLELDPVGFAELLGLHEDEVRETAPPVSFAGSFGSGLTVELPRLTPRPLENRISRRVPAFWRYRLAHSVRPQNLDVTYRLISIGGTAGRLDSANTADSNILVTAHALVPHEVELEDDEVVVEGGLELVLDLGQLKHSGRYSGTLYLTVDQR